MSSPPDIETSLRALDWRPPAPEFLQRTLEAALSERARLSTKTQRRSILAFIPPPLRLPLAACWLLALFLRVTTPEAVPQSTLENLAKLPAPTPAQFFAHLEQAERLAHELLEQLRAPLPPL